MYEFPNTDLYKLHKMIFEIRNSSVLKAEFLQNQEAVMKRFGLTEAEIELLKKGDPIEMYRFGVFPYLLHYYWLVIKGASKGSKEDMILFEEDD